MHSNESNINSKEESLRTATNFEKSIASAPTCFV